MGHGRLDGMVSRVTSQLSSRRNPRPYLFAIYAHLERSLGRAPTALPPPLVHDGLDNDEKRPFEICSPPLLSLSLSLVAGKGRQSRFPKFPRGPPMAAVH